MTEPSTTAPAHPDELQAFSLLRSIPRAELQAVAKVLKVRRFDPGEVLFERGDPGDAMYLIRSGQVRIFLRSDQEEDVTFRYYGAGQIVGEFALIDDQPRSASADAYDLAQLLILEKQDFVNLLRDHPIIGIEMMRSLTERIRYTTRFLEKLLAAVHLLQNDQYERALQEMAVEATEDEVRSLIASFIEMVHSVQARQQRRSSAH